MSRATIDAELIVIGAQLESFHDRVAALDNTAPGFTQDYQKLMRESIAINRKLLEIKAERDAL